jgi:uncharacterized membrane protein YkoI
MRIRSVLFITAGVVGAAVGGAAVSAALTDPDVSVEPIELNSVVATAPAPASDPATTPTPAPDPAVTMPVTVQEVVGLEQLVGSLRAGEDPDDWYVSGVEVDVGPDGWIGSAPGIDDFDGDGGVEPLLDELRGLEGRTVTFGVRYEVDDDRDDADVFTIEGLAYRDPNGAPAPWQSTPSGVEATPDEIAAAAAAAVGEGARTIDLDRETDDGWNGWDVEVRAADGREYQVDLDLAGNVIDVRLDID